jgi:hypothetical protein
MLKEVKDMYEFWLAFKVFLMACGCLALGAALVYGAWILLPYRLKEKLYNKAFENDNGES